MRVGKIFDESHKISFDAVHPIVRDKGGSELCKFHRTPGGLHVARIAIASERLDRTVAEMGEMHRTDQPQGEK